MHSAQELQVQLLLLPEVRAVKLILFLQVVHQHLPVPPASVTRPHNPCPLPLQLRHRYYRAKLM